MDDSFSSLHDIEFVEMPQSSDSMRPNKVLIRSRNTVSMSALTREEEAFHKELAAALGNDWRSNLDLTSSERFKRFVDNLCRSKSSPAICSHHKEDNIPENERRNINQSSSNVIWNKLDGWTKMICLAIIILVGLIMMQRFDVL